MPGEERDPDLDRLHDEILTLVVEVQEHFGDHEPSEEEVREYLRERLIRQGRSPEEADRFMAELEAELETGEG